MRNRLTLAAILTIMTVTAAPGQQPSAPRRAAGLAIPDRPTDPHPGQVTVEFDRFRNQTSALLKGLRTGTALQLDVLFLMPGQQPTRPALVTFMFNSIAHDWEYLRCHHVDLLVDGRPFPVRDASYDGRVETGYVVEYITFHTSANELLRLASATAIEGRICLTEFRFGSAEILALRDLASRMK